MKRAVPLLVLGGCLVAAVLWAVGQGQQPAGTPIPAATTATPAAPRPVVQQPTVTPEGEKVVHTFADEAGMRQFTGLWQQRQDLLVRLQVLQAYWNNEEETLTQANAGLGSTYGLEVDPTKTYSLDTDTRTLIERPDPDQPGAGEAAVQPAAAAEPAPEGEVASERVLHTFADEQEMQAFRTLWQQRQGAVVRMAVLQSLWDEQTAALRQLNDRLSSSYGMDLAKDYYLDGERRILIERETPPPAPAPPADQPDVAAPVPAAP